MHDHVSVARLGILLRKRSFALGILALLWAGIAASAQERALQLDPARTTIHFTLGAALHTVHGTFRLKDGALSLDPVSGKLTGEIVVDTKSGESGNGMRDRKMHREVLESERYPEIIFRPDRVEGTVAAEGKSSVQVHGIFRIHGTDHEFTVPAEVEIRPDGWSATVHFAIPYVKWGMKNPSTLFLRVGESVEIELVAAGSVVKP
jgi:polyisoprenoid-binding protein YceI